MIGFIFRFVWVVKIEVDELCMIVIFVKCVREIYLWKYINIVDSYMSWYIIYYLLFRSLVLYKVF